MSCGDADLDELRDEIDLEALTSELDALTGKVAPSDVILRIAELENAHRRYVLDNYPRFVQQSEAYLDLFDKGCPSRQLC